MGKQGKGKGYQRRAKKEKREKLAKQGPQKNWEVNKDYVCAERKNDDFFAYYKAQGICPEEEWDAFVAALQDDLPVTFRINTCQTTGFHHKIIQALQDGTFGAPDSKIDVLGKQVSPPYPLPWYPGKFAWCFDVSKKGLKKAETVRRLHKFLVTVQDQGNINRQEAVSMIPPLLLDVQSHHVVLDMCAAPGSKTAQLIEALHANLHYSQIPTGLVVANDADPKRAYMLVHQLKRLGSPCYLVTTHEGQFFPSISILPGNGAGMTTEQIEKRERVDDFVKFDRILCDVPCSGDGTMRKNMLLWRKWAHHFGLGLHNLQLSIALRAAAILKVGGLMVYSTCTFNPIENEAVVAHLLRRAEGSLELVDVSDRLPGLKRNTGISHWKVFGGVTEQYATYEDVPPRRRKSVKKTMFPPSEEEVAKFHLNRCLRVLPHHQNTGGFFIVLIRKTAPFNPAAPKDAAPEEKEKGSSSSAGAGDAEEEELMAAVDPTLTRRQQQRMDRDRKKRSKQEEQQSKDAADKDAGIDTADKDTAAKQEKEEKKEEKESEEDEESAKRRKVDGDKKEENKPQRQKQDQKKKGDTNFAEDPFVPISERLFTTLKGYYGIGSGLNNEHFFARSKEGKRIYMVGPGLASVLMDPRNTKLKVVHSGLRCFEAWDSKRSELSDGNYRCVQEGVYLLASHMTKQVVRVNESQFQQLMNNHSVPLSLLSAELAEANARVGSIVVHLLGDKQSLFVSVYYSEHSLVALMQKVEKQSYLSLMHFDVDAIGAHCKEDGNDGEGKEGKEDKTKDEDKDDIEPTAEPEPSPSP